MRLSRLLAIAALAACGATDLPFSGEGDLRAHALTTPDGRERSYLVYSPPGYPGVRRPAVLVLHGGGGNARGTVERAFTPAAADRHDTLAVYPEGIGRRMLGRRFATWNAGRCCGEAAEQDVDDVAFIRELLDRLVSDHGADPERIYATGISNGGMMATRLACELGDRIAAISAVASPGYVDGCVAEHPVPVQILHGTADRCALYEGGERCGGCWEQALGQALGRDFPERRFPCTGAEAQAHFWRRVNGCEDAARVTREVGSARCVEYANCTSGRPVSLCSFEGGGHAWPGGLLGCDPRRRFCKAFADVTGPIPEDLDANDLMWSFFERRAR